MKLINAFLLNLWISVLITIFHLKGYYPFWVGVLFAGLIGAVLGVKAAIDEQRERIDK